jgi:diaminopimelate epimerase
VNSGQGLRFVKGHGTANDFVVLPDPDDDLDLSPEIVAAICDRRRGVGADGVLRVVRTNVVPGAADDAEARWFMDYRNADGSIAEMCGNGIRVFGRYLVDAGYAKPGSIHIATRDGVKVVDVPLTGDVTVDMGVVRVLEVGAVEVDIAGRALPGVAVTAGNPHVVVPVDDVDVLTPFSEPPTVRPSAAFPDGTNVEIVSVGGPRVLTVRVHERGSGETWSCGTGACAVATVARAGGLAGASTETDPDGTTTYAVDLPGGRLLVRTCPDGRTLLTGPAVLVAQGIIRVEAFGAVTVLAETGS